MDLAEPEVSRGGTPGRDPNCYANEPVRARFIGSLLGTMCGDALGMPVEGWPPIEIVRRYGIIRELVAGRLAAGSYTDDTQMTIALAESLVARRGYDSGDLAERLLAGYEPRRGYGRGSREALARLAAGVPWEEAGKSSFGVGSFGNGAAGRVAPIGLLYHRELGLAAQVARLSAEPTHTHPLGKAGAAVQAMAVALALRWGVTEGVEPSPSQFLDLIEAELEPHEGLFRERLETIRLLLDRDEPPPLQARSTEMLEWAKSVGSVLGNDSRSFQSVPPAIYVFLCCLSDAETGMTAAVALGGDTDTIGAMAGALFGAYLGVDGLPQHWIAGLEGGARGRDYVGGLADDLFLLWLEELSGCVPSPPELEGRA